MEDLRAQVIEAMKNDTDYDFIANNYYKMDNTDLKDILLELLYGMYISEKYGLDAKEVAIEGLKERWEDN